MKKLWMILSLAGAMVATNVSASLTVTLTEAGGNANGGGLFQAVTSANGTFYTYCLSIATTFVPGTTYNYAFSSSIDAVVPPVVPTYITEGTAYMYSQFLQGNAFYGANLNATTLNDVQATIWYLQGLLVDSSGNYGTGGMIDPENNANLSSLINAILPTLSADTGGLSTTQLESNGNGAYGVVAMNLYGANGSIHQPQLAVVPEATTVIAGVLLLLPLGASTLRILRRNRMS